MRIEKDQLTTVAIIAVLSAAFVFAVWMPARKSRAAAATRVAAADAELAALRAGDASVEAWQKRVDGLRAEVETTAHRVPQGHELAPLLRGLSRSLSDRAVAAEQLVTDEIESYAEYDVIPIHMEFQTGFPVLWEVVRELEHMPRLIRVDRLEIEAVEVDDKPRRGGDDVAGDEPPAAVSPPVAVTLQLATFSTGVEH